MPNYVKLTRENVIFDSDKIEYIMMKDNGDVSIDIGESEIEITKYKFNELEVLVDITLEIT